MPVEFLIFGLTLAGVAIAVAFTHFPARTAARESPALALRGD